MNKEELIPLLKAVLFASGDPLSPDEIANALELEIKDVLSALEKIRNNSQKDTSGVELLVLDERFQYCAKKKYEEPIRRVLGREKNSSLSQAAFEVLAVIAYNQPVTKAFVEQVRGVDCSGVINTLCKKNLIAECGRLDLPGRPLIYCITDNFLRCFGITGLNELPKIPEREAEEQDSALPETEEPA